MIDLENLASFIRSALTPVGVAALHKQPQSQVLAFVNSPQWQYLRSLFFIPAYCENVILLNAPPIVLQLLSVFDHFLFHPHRNPVTGRGHPDSVRLIQAAVAHNKGGRFLLQGSLGASALFDAVDQSQIPVEYLQQSRESEEGGKMSVDERKSHAAGGVIENTPETVSLFKSLFQLTLQIEGSLELAKERNPTLASVAMAQGGKNGAFAALHDLRSRSPVSASSKSREKKAERRDVGTETAHKDPLGNMQSNGGVEMIPRFVGDRTEFEGSGDPGYHQQQQQARAVISTAGKKKVQEGGSKKPGAGSSNRKRSGIPASTVATTGQQTSPPGGDASASHEQQHTSSKRGDRGKKGGVSMTTVSVDESDVSLESKKQVRKGGVGKETLTSAPSKKKKRRRSSVAETNTTTTTSSPTTSSRTPSPKGGGVPKKRVAGRRKSSRSPRSSDAQPPEVPVSPVLSTPPRSPVTMVTTSRPLPAVEAESAVPPASSGTAVAWGDSGLDAQEQQGGGVFLPLNGISAEVPTLRSERVVGDVREPSAGDTLLAEDRSISDGKNEATPESSVRVGEKLGGARTDGSLAAVAETESRSGYEEPRAGVFEIHSRDDFPDKKTQGFESATAATIEGSMFSLGSGLTAAGVGAQGGAWGSVNFSGNGGTGLGWGAASAEAWGSPTSGVVEPKKKPDIGRGYYLDEEEALEAADDFDDI